MASIYDLPKMPQPYPDSKPWFDLRSYVINGWEMSGTGFIFRASLDGNMARIYLRTRRGLSRFVTETLPDELLPPGQMIFTSYAAKEGNIGLLVETSGSSALYAPERGYDGLIDGTLGNLVVQASYVRRSL